MKKLLSSLAFSALLLLTTACRSRDQNEGTIEITLSGWQSNPIESQLLEKVIDQFEAKYPNIKVKHEVINSQYMDVIKTRLIGDVAPDVFYLDAFEAPLLMKFEVLEPLNSYIKPEFNISDFEPTLINAFKRNEKIYGIPKDFSTLALFYDQTAFAKADIKQPPKTWNELIQYSKKLTRSEPDGKPNRYGFGITPELPRQQFIIQAFGGKLVDRNNYAAFATPESLKGLQLVIEQYRRDRSSAQPSDVGASSGDDMLGQGRVAMLLSGAWSIPYFKETFPNLKFATAEVPTINGRKGTMAYTVAYVMNRKSTHKEAAWKLIEYLTSEAVMKTSGNQGFALPSRRSVLAELQSDRTSLYAPLIAGAKYATTWQAGETLPTILTNFDNQFVSALIGQQSLKDAMQKAQDTANREIYLSN
ncbi:ABC transporter substrate-binding protein [Phormidesmis priestleyi ULC007]|uniref:ABC transporter substrate-binding protein n=1 Tax=Phormidesmis priestleyi ULC007 TaxID=1920490 RepID=A0A2T1DE76_9CYAN|nr:ABC transporter substrate-binding protein [Phormidesmis priestleyi]PSB18741.1 ABC transporter substrate-binding protein [Phormidesmis priestleyi ULC007]PZO51499.1 MAG: ABC transporter substrate-binding protein [Phormidesmis priestleyi]